MKLRVNQINSVSILLKTINILVFSRKSPPTTARPLPLIFLGSLLVKLMSPQIPT